jgi:Fur family transcriptional regulator, ferric uptake regulator
MENSEVCHGYYGRFKRQGLRMTLPRQVILQALDESEKYLTAEEVFLEVHKDYPQIGLATVYRTLSLLTDMALVTKFEFGEGKARYELSERGQKEKHHHLLICTSCYRVIKYSEFSEEEKKLYKEIEEKMQETKNFSIKRHVVQYYGLCSACSGSSGKK